MQVPERNSRRSLTGSWGKAVKNRLWALLLGAAVMVGLAVWLAPASPPESDPVRVRPAAPAVSYQPRRSFDSSGANLVYELAPKWPRDASLAEIAGIWRNIGERHLRPVDQGAPGTPADRLHSLMHNALLLNYEGRTQLALQQLAEARSIVAGDRALASEWLYTIIFLQGVTSLRQGENENCIACRGESSCILPIAEEAVHTNQRGSRQAIGFFSEYLQQFPDDHGVRWLLNLAHMTLGEHPHRVDARFVMDLAPPGEPESAIGIFRNVSEDVGLSRLNQAGGGIMDDFDRDGWLDIITSSMDPTQSMACFRNTGQGSFHECSTAAGLESQLGGLYCVQADFDNDGFLDVFVPRGAWLSAPVRPSLLLNNGDGTFSDVTADSGLLEPGNSISASWGDFDNDGCLDLYVCCERQPNRLYRNRGDGTFEDVARTAGVTGDGVPACKGAAWLDFDNDRQLDLFVTFYGGAARLYRNQGDRTFADVTAAMQVDGPQQGFACWAWDYDNDGWLDIFATSYDLTLADIVNGIVGKPHARHSNRLYRNRQGQGFEDVTSDAGLDLVFGTMGSNYGDFDNDGWLDCYLGTGDPRLETLVPNRMFRNIGGQRFSEITTSARTGHLQKGHSVACGDWDRDGDNDLFVEMGGAVPGDQSHNVLFENPGQGNHWLTVRLIGTWSARTPIGARMACDVEETGQSICRLISTGSTFGANPLQETIGLGAGPGIKSLRIDWPSAPDPQEISELAAGQSIVVTESGSLHAMPGPSTRSND